jgi:MFS family permease
MASPTVSPRYAWFLLSLLTLLNIVNFVDRQLVVSLQVPLKADLQLDDVQITLLAGYAFAVVYSLAGLYLGTLADRWHRPRLIAAGLLVWSAMTAASGLAQSFWHLAAARVLVAVGEATLTPAAVAMLGDVFGPRQRSLASGLYYLGIPLGASLSLIVAGVFEPIPGVGWRGCYLGLGGVGLLLVGVIAWTRDPPRGGMESASSSQPAAPSPVVPLRRQLGDLFATLWQSPALVATMVGAVAINVGVGTTFLDPSWLVAERGFTKSQAPLFLGTIFLFGGSLGNFLGGWLGDLFHRHFLSGRLLALVCVQLAVTPFGIVFRFANPESLWFPVGWFVSSIFVTMMYGPVLATVQELTPVRMRATMIAFLLICLNILGASLGALLAAQLTRYLGSYTWGIFLTSLISLIAIPTFLLAARRFPADQARALHLEQKAVAP